MGALEDLLHREADPVGTLDRERLADGRQAHRPLDLPDLLLHADDEVPWRCDRLLADGHLTLVAGRGGEGKSFLGLAFAGGVLLGTTVAGIRCEKGRVAIFDGENGPRVIGRRFTVPRAEYDEARERAERAEAESKRLKRELGHD